MENGFAEEQLVWAVNGSTGLTLPGGASLARVREALRAWIDARLAADLETVIRLLYQVDVDEQRLKYLLREKVGEDAAGVMADLIIDRQLEKIAYRLSQKEVPPPPETDENGAPLERW